MRDVAAVADSGPLIFLARIDLLNLLPELFSEILIPPEVRDEVIVRGRNHPGAYAVSQAKWLTVQAPDPQLVKSLSILVDAGEAEAIALAQTTEDCTVLLDVPMEQNPSRRDAANISRCFSGGRRRIEYFAVLS
ncbi:hypothetical protein VU01_12164 [Candidatus Electrothrix marina]|uniref:Nucleic acid-binding protein, contains PIN domain n=1 Tax=Candidatus Electrothrix marina TaxID=1859130 RepID=A0A444JDJ2_9BACT|nr:hypothetical protein VU01_12164 [Candidatus Electrothrix marina]